VVQARCKTHAIYPLRSSVCPHSLPPSYAIDQIAFTLRLSSHLTLIYSP
jgi:hypothetical protein